MRPIIKVEGLGKQFRIGAGQAPYKTLRESIVGAAQAPLRLFNRNDNSEDRVIWALKDINFEVMPGEVIGVIGRNGAGKSTLLKILSRITEPTAGRVDLYGRVGSLLEVGTGFHPELSGRENIYLNGAILGMRREEINRRFDEIVSFAEVERFIDTPVKHYSSGMHLRLAFAVAAHLDPEILVVDEALAVGDVSFQKKCLGKMSDVSREGRTVLFVSHNMAALRGLCNKAIWLSDGTIQLTGEVGEIVSRYLKAGESAATERRWEYPDAASGNEKARLRLARVVREEGSDREITVSTPIRIEFEYWNNLPGALLNLSLVLYNSEGVCVLNSASPAKTLSAGLVSCVCHIPGNLLNDTSYRVRLLIVKDMAIPLVDLDNVCSFTVSDGDREGHWYGKWAGVVRPKFDWEIAAS